MYALTLTSWLLKKLLAYPMVPFLENAILPFISVNKILASF
jgi:hypothetical protein